MTSRAMAPNPIAWGRHRLTFGKRTLIMGIVNVTPDSFSDGGDFFSCEEAVKQAVKMVSEGADILDIGGESTRPFSEPVSEEEEIQRVVPVIREIAARVTVPISIDTNKAGVAKAAIDAGAAIINDITALQGDPGMAALAAHTQVPVILMHMIGTPKDMQVAPRYDDVVKEIHAFFASVIAKAETAGVSREKIILDPGIGFGKNIDHNLQLIYGLGTFLEFGRPILMGTSRKAFIRNLLKPPDGEPVSPKSPMVATGTQATVAASALNGAHIVRVHDVAETCATLKIIDAVRGAVK